MCNEAVKTEPILLGCVPDQLKTQEMCNQAVRNKSWLSFVPDHFKTQEMCNKVLHTMPKASERFKTQGMCKKTVEKDPSMLKYVPDHLKVGSS